MSFYKDIVVSTELIQMKAIYDRTDQTKITFHSLYIKKDHKKCSKSEFKNACTRIKWKSKWTLWRWRWRWKLNIFKDPLPVKTLTTMNFIRWSRPISLIKVFSVITWIIIQENLTSYISHMKDIHSSHSAPSKAQIDKFK